MTFSEWRLLLLLVISVCINYIDRVNLSIAAPVLTTELKLSASQMGMLLSAFFWSYAAFLVIAGWLVDRFPVKWVFAIGFFVWSGATAAAGFATGFTALLILRVLLGAGESVAFPAYSKIIVTGFSERHRGTTNALIDAGSKLGPALGTLLGGLIVAAFGWRFLFVAIGVGGMVWLAPWLLWAPKSATAAERKAHGGPSFLDILKQRSAWGTFLGLFCLNYAWYFLLTWLPSYLVKERHFSMNMMAVLGSAPFWGLAATASLAGWASDYWIGRGATPTLVRKTFVAGGLLLCTLVLPAAIIPNPMVCVALITAACLSFGLCTSNHWAVSQTLAGPLAAGKWTGMQNAFGNLAGVVAPWLTGLIVDKTGSFYFAFVLVACFLVAGAASYIFIVGPLVQIEWNKKRASV
jgi:MFS family permease